jgi:hypothetical protein
MGYHKERQIEEQARGYGHAGKYACTSCIGDEALAAVVAEDPLDEPCSYCGGGPTAPLDDVIGRAIEGLNSEYGSEATEAVPWDSEVGAYVVPALQAIELIEVHWSGKPDSDLWEDIVDVVDDLTWFDRNPLAVRPHEDLQSSWTRFSKLVTATQSDDLHPTSPTPDDADDWIGTEQTLDYIGDALANLPQIISELAPGTGLWRARYAPNEGGWRRARDLAPPEHGEIHRPGRMSRPGVNWFYGASSMETAVAEIFRPGDARFLTVGRFDTTQPLRLLDLSDEGLALPSIFDLEAQGGRLAAIFMHGFAIDISKPVDDSRLGDYRPTQLVTDFVRVGLEGRITDPIDGIIFPSSRATGQNFVLFHGRTACIDVGERPTAETRLILDPMTIGVLRPRKAAQMAAQQQRQRESRASLFGVSAWSDWTIRRAMVGLGPLRL